MPDLVSEAMKLGGVPEGYAEVIVEFFQFQNEGDIIKGRLVGKDQVTVRGNRIGKYTLIRESDSTRVAFLGGVQLDELMKNVAVGKELLIVFTHKEKTGQGEGYDMKRFKVYFKEQG